MAASHGRLANSSETSAAMSGLCALPDFDLARATRPQRLQKSTSKPTSPSKPT
jgi:hypothetical protein